MKRYLLPASALALTFGESLLTGLRCLGIVLGVMSTSYGSAHAAARALATDNWSDFGFVPRGGRYNPDETILNTTNVGGLSVLWSAQDGSFPFTSFAVVNGFVYTGTSAFNAATGKLVWGADAGGDSPAVSKGKVYIDTGNGLCAYTAVSGTNL
jgi:hypothetical protein